MSFACVSVWTRLCRSNKFFNFFGDCPQMRKALYIISILIIWILLDFCGNMPTVVPHVVLVAKEYADTIENLAKARSSESDKSAWRGYFCDNDWRHSRCIRRGDSGSDKRDRHSRIKRQERRDKSDSYKSERKIGKVIVFR